ncbi:MAG: type I methionyl aminopeptidase [Sphaerobacteraceae bacterium]|nr:MAG: type I methionyl aminopeptidase [Sphaerobacteraceae bacterium]
MRTRLKRPEQIDRMREAGQIVAETLKLMRQHVAPGVTTRQLDEIAEANIRKHGATPSYKGYRGFPATVCASVNTVIVHGIPNDVPLEEGDIISVDVGAKHRGFHGDATISLPVGTVSDEAQRLMDVCKQALYAGIDKTRAGNRLTDISATIQNCVESAGFSVVRDLYGHGIGTNLHEEPLLPHYGSPGQGPRLRAGMVLTIEPMIAAGDPAWETLSDNWTVVTLDGSLSAQFEHTVAITDNGPEILTDLGD